MRIINSNYFIASVFSLLLCGYAFTVWPALSGIFLFDDYPNLLNLSIISGQIDWPHIGAYLAEFPGSPGRPLSALSFLINDMAWPSDPFGFKYTNVMIHLLNGVLLFGFLRQLTKANPLLPQSTLWPLLVMAAWLFHPLQLSAQLLVVQRMTLLSATFSFAGLWAYVSLLQKVERPIGAFIAMAALGISTILAFLCKENGALLPLLALVINSTILADLLQTKTKAVKCFIFSACAAPSAFLIIAIIYFGTRPDAYALRAYNLQERLLTETHILTVYLKQIIMPQISGSGIYHDNYPITTSIIANPITVLYITLVVISISFALIIRKKLPLLCFAILWFFAGHAMESTALPLELYFEHRNYLPLLGPVMALTALPFFVNPHLKRTAALLLSIWLIMIATITALQAPVWGQQALMATLWANEKPYSMRATQELAKFYYDSRKPQEAADTLMSAYNRGVHYADLPMGALLTKCWIPTTQINGDILFITKNAIRKSPHSFGSVDALKRLREASAKNKCPKLLNSDSWWGLSEDMLSNHKIRVNSEDFIRIERAKNRIDAKDLSGAMIELEEAYELKPSTLLSYKIAEILLSAGLVEDAKKWLEKGLHAKKPFFDEMMSSDKKKSLALLNDLENLRK